MNKITITYHEYMNNDLNEHISEMYELIKNMNTTEIQSFCIRNNADFYVYNDAQMIYTPNDLNDLLLHHKYELHHYDDCRDCIYFDNDFIRELIINDIVQNDYIYDVDNIKKCVIL